MLMPPGQHWAKVPERDAAQENRSLTAEVPLANIVTNKGCRAAELKILVALRNALAPEIAR